MPTIQAKPGLKRDSEWLARQLGIKKTDVAAMRDLLPPPRHNGDDPRWNAGEVEAWRRAGRLPIRYAGQPVSCRVALGKVYQPDDWGSADVAARMRSLVNGHRDLAGRTVPVVVATESPVPIFDFDRGEIVNEVLLMSGLMLPDSRQVPLLDTHRRESIDSVIGSVRGLKVDGNLLLGKAKFSSLSRGAFELITGNHLTDCSAGYLIIKRQFVPRGKSEIVEGRQFVGPAWVVTQWKLKEASACSIGADTNAVFY